MLLAAAGDYLPIACKAFFFVSSKIVHDDEKKFS